MFGTEHSAPPGRPGERPPTLDRALVEALAGLSLAQINIGNTQRQMWRKLDTVTGVVVAGTITSISLLIAVLVAVIVG